ncbi:hypothetical protein R3W88_030586 [Solanum pinnatisectum]|uniref:Fatty acid desaturase domain-containing protein n=1 Tax=Solanum pinnatisectum TaxID=50273 RepID=A0AAV9LKG5_9SOLN|nr:hypothetical protein R3W88_030586 [Solanum pinnatisectum]
MGGVGNMSTPTTKTTEQKKNPLERVPISKRPFIVGDIKKVIPPHCFQPSLVRSFSYLIQDLMLVSVSYYIASTYFHILPSMLAWPIYWIVVGCVCTGIWFIAHECSHNAFSKYKWINDTIGFILHSVLLTPYFSWKYSHRRHHSNTNSLEYDENHVPKVKTKLRWYTKLYVNNPLGRLFILAFTLTIGLPLYYAINVTGRPYDRFTSHYYPYSPIYNDRERLQIYISDVGVVATIYVLYRVALTKGLTWVICIYGVPLLIVNGFVVLITLLHHTHPSLPHYDSSEWDWLRGALATVDRDYGVLNKVFHNITDTHVLHHLFSNIPHYHAMEATKAMRPLLGEYYQFDGTPFYKAIWRDFECIYVEKDESSLDKGASSGIGLEFCLDLAKAGCRIIAVARRVDRLTTLCNQINSEGPARRAFALELDVMANGATIEAAVKIAWDTFGRIDVLVNNAGVRGSVSSSLKLSEEEWEHTFKTNLRGAWLVSKYVCRHMRDAKQGGGSVINITSIAALNRVVVPGTLSYASSKMALDMVTKIMALELGVDKIRVNSISPGIFKSEITESLFQQKWLHKFLYKTLPQRFVGTTDPALTSVIRYLIHDSSEYVTGNIFIVDGGGTLPGVPIFSSL